MQNNNPNIPDQTVPNPIKNEKPVVNSNPVMINKPEIKPRINIINILVIIVILLFITGGILIYKIIADKQTIAMPTPTPTPTTYPIDTAKHPISTSSAYMELQQRVSNLEQSIRSYNAYDPALSPPVIELPLGFVKN